MSTSNQEALERLRRAREKKSPKIPLPIAKVSERRKVQIVEDKKTTALDKEFYAEIWAACPHQCEECGKKLGREPLTLFFHHLLPKRDYPEFRYSPENIMILCPDHHTQAEVMIDKVPKVKARTEQTRKLLLNQ